MAEFTLQRTFKAPPQVLWEVLSDFEHSRSPRMKVNLLEKGNPHAHNIGAVRRIEWNGQAFKEKLTAVDPGRFFTYQLLEGAPVKDYFGTIALRPHQGGTYLEWKVTYRPKFPWPACLINWKAKQTIRRILDEIERAFAGTEPS